MHGVIPVANRVLQVNRGIGYCQQVDSISLTANQTNSVTPYYIKCADFLWCATVIQSTGSFRMKIKATWEGQEISNGYIQSSLFKATGADMLHHAPKACPANRTLEFTLDDLSAAPNTVDISLWGFDAVPDDFKQYGPGRGLFIYVTDPINHIVLVQNQSSVFGIQIQDDSHFRCTAIIGSGQQATTKGVPTFKDPRSLSAVSLAQNLIPLNSWVGTAAKPFYMPGTFIAQKSTTIGHTLLDTGAAPTVDLLYLGERLQDDDWLRSDLGLPEGH
jgi:hypothetical protein